MSKSTFSPNFLSEGLYTLNSAVRYDSSAIVLEKEIFTLPIPKIRLLGLAHIEESIESLFYSNMLELRVESTPGDEDAAIDTVFEMQAPTLTSFFALQLIDIPLCFRSTKSLYAPVASMPHLRFISMISRHGRKQYVSKYYSTALNKIACRWLTNEFGGGKSPDWRPLYSAFAEGKLIRTSEPGHQSSFTDELPTFTASDVYSQDLSNDGDIINSRDWLHNFIYEEIESYSPIFNFYVQKVDKMKRKHSRGKTGKYSISWKYVPKYRRLAAVLRWFVRDIRFQKQKTLELRILKSFETLFFDKESHLIHQLRQFVHKFAYQNHKKTLLKTLRTSGSR